MIHFGRFIANRFAGSGDKLVELLGGDHRAAAKAGDDVSGAFTDLDRNAAEFCLQGFGCV